MISSSKELLSFTKKNIPKNTFNAISKFLEIIDSNNKIRGRQDGTVDIPHISKNSESPSVSYYEKELLEKGWTRNEIYGISKNPAEISLEQVMKERSTIVSITDTIIKIQDPNKALRIHGKQTKRY